MNPSPGDLDDFLEDLLPAALGVAVAVRDRDGAEVARILEPLGVLELRALAVALAALVPDDVPFRELLAWTHTDPGKWCTGCEQMRPRAAFHIDRSKPDGLKSQCRGCVQAGKTARLRQAGGGPLEPVSLGEVA